MESTKPLGKTILCIDDDPDDLQLLREAVKSIDGNITILEANDGEDGMAQLSRLKEAGNLPCLVVLDINMPRMDGKTTFVKIRSDDGLSAVPVVIFSTSSSPLDKMFFTREQVAYFTKPINFSQLVEVAAAMISYCKA
jgi:CheY-like chemotaxis protein